MFSFNYANELLGSYITCIFTMYYSVSLYNDSITFLTSLKTMHGFAINFVWIFLEWTPTKCVKILVLSIF